MFDFKINKKEGIIMNGNRSLSYLLLNRTIMYMSLALPLIVLPVPLWVTLAVPAFVYLSVLMPSPTVEFIVKFLYSFLLRPGLYIAALVFAIGGKQDFVAISFYILAALQSFFIVKNFFSALLFVASFFSWLDR